MVGADSLALLPLVLGEPSERSVPAAIEYLEGKLLELPQVDCQLVHRFSAGCYLREVTMPADTFVIGHCHRTRHFNIVLTGRAIVMIDGKIEHIEAPLIFESQPRVRKVLRILEEMKWATVHVTHERDLGRLAEMLIEKSAAFLAAEMADKKRLEAYLQTLTP